MNILIFLLIIALPASALAQSRLEQRVDELEQRVRILEQQGGRHTFLTEPLQKNAQEPVFPGKFIEPTSSGRRWIRFSADGTFLFHTPSDQFTGTWEKSGAKVSIRVQSGFTEEFHIVGDALVDSRNITWMKAKDK